MEARHRRGLPAFLNSEPPCSVLPLSPAPTCVARWAAPASCCAAGEDAIRHLFSRGTHREFGYAAIVCMLIFYFLGAAWTGACGRRGNTTRHPAAGVVAAIGATASLRPLAAAVLPCRRWWLIKCAAPSTCCSRLCHLVWRLRAHAADWRLHRPPGGAGGGGHCGGARRRVAGVSWQGGRQGGVVRPHVAAAPGRGVAGVSRGGGGERGPAAVGAVPRGSAVGRPVAPLPPPPRTARFFAARPPGCSSHPPPGPGSTLERLRSSAPALSWAA